MLSTVQIEKRPILFGVIFLAGLVLAFLIATILRFPSGFSAFWLPIGVGLVGLVTAPRRWWIPLLILITAVDGVAGYLMFDSVRIPDDAFQVGLAALLIDRLGGKRPFRFDSVQRYVTFLLFVAGSLAFTTWFTAPATINWIGYWLGGVLGVTMVAPLVLMDNAPQKSAQKVEAVLSVLVLYLLARTIFLRPQFSEFAPYEYPYFVFPLLVWICIRLPDKLVAGASVLLAGIAVYYTGLGHGPFLALPLPPIEQLLLLQSYLLLVTIGPPLLSLALFEREQEAVETRLYQKGLEQSELTYKTLFESSGIAMGVLKDGTLLKANPTLQLLLNLDDRRSTLLDLSPEFQPDGRTSELVARSLFEKGKWELATTLWSARTELGRDLQLELFVFPLSGEDEVALIALDVTESRHLLRVLKAEQRSLEARVELRAQELIQANAELVQSVKTKREFIAQLSHELKTPLTALMAQNDTLLEELFGPLNPRQKQAVLEMKENGERLSRLVLDLLDLNKIEAGKVKVHLEQIHLRGPLLEALNSVEFLCERKGVSAIIEGDLDSEVLSDHEILRRVLTLLLGRAARQTPEGDSFGAKIDAWPTVNRVEITVWNSGQPLTEHAINTLFDLYAYRSEEEERRETGIGLAVAFHLLNLVKGELQVQNSEDGTLLTVSLPREEGAS